MAKRKATSASEARELFLILESLALAMDVARGPYSFDDLPRDRLRALNEAHDLFLGLEEQWDALSEKERSAGATQPFDVRQWRSKP